jgi:hypothetical protein
MIILKKIIRISRVNKISSIADFFFYDTETADFWGISYHSLYFLNFNISLQLKSISDTFHIVTKTQASSNILLILQPTYVCVLALYPITEQDMWFRKDAE